MAENLRFSLQFDKNDPDSFKAAEYLNQLGRSKSKIIVKAVLAYKRGNQDTAGAAYSVPVPANIAPGASYAQLKAIVTEVLKEQGMIKPVTPLASNTSCEKDTDKKSGSKQTTTAEVVPVVTKPVVIPEHPAVSDNSAPALSDDVLESIAASLKMFGEG